MEWAARLNGARYFRTLRHVRPWQVLGRLLAAARRPWVRAPAVPPGLHGGLMPAAAFPVHDPWNRRTDVLRGRFRFLDATRDLGTPVDWIAVEAPLLWRFNLHYFHYLPLLEAEERIALCREWIAANPPGRGVAWRPYPLSLRIVQWCRAGLPVSDVQASLYQQAGFLFRTVETYVPGNHLIENGRALLYAGTFFGGQGESGRWRERGLAILVEESEEQILADGGHFERSPMYHALMTEAYLDALHVLPQDHAARPRLAGVASRMLDFLVSLTGPDGRLALLNDATEEIATPTGRLVAYAAALGLPPPQRREAFPESGYFVVRGPRVHLVVDGGPIGPDHIPAHAHADIFTYELWVGGLLFVTDTGVFDYAPGAMRDYVRGTRAHNTVSVDDEDQAECWASFRVARRYPPRDVRFERSDDEIRFAGSFDGYGRLIGDGIRHERVITVHDGGGSVTVRDSVTGRGRHDVASRIHLHPEVEVSRDGASFRLRRGTVTCELVSQGLTARLETGWYCPRFGLRLERQVLVLEEQGLKLPATLGYTFRAPDLGESRGRPKSL